MKGTILFVDDECGDSFKDYIESNLEYFVELYKSGFDAIQAVDEGLEFGLAMVDLSLPGVDGERVINHIRNKYPNKPIVCISCYYYKPNSATALLQKVIHGNELEDIITRLYPHKSPNSSDKT